MRLLALETSTDRLSVALLTGRGEFARDIDAGQRHSALALHAIHELFAEAKLTVGDIDFVAFGQGPGSFVGVRIACGLAQGIALGCGKPLVPVTTTLALAEQAAEAVASSVRTGQSATVLVAIDARLGEFYLAAYRKNETAATGWDTVVAPILAGADSLPALSALGNPSAIVGIGSAFAVPTLRDALLRAYGTQLVHVTENALPRARDVARVAQRQITNAGDAAIFLPEDVAPLYLRDNIALTIAERAHLKTAATPALASVQI
jgi:tRNA threonylcarbamoyladenosine biosynthesis protein TsaB